MTARVDAWLDALPPDLARHARVLRALLAECQRDARVRVLVVGCSIGRGAADEHSDIDANITVRDDAWPSFLDDVDALLDRTGDVLDRSHHVMPDAGVPHRRTFAMYRDGVPLDLVVNPLSAWSRHGRAPDTVALHDPDGMAEPLLEPRGAHASREELREWAMLGYEAVSNCVKYLRRGSPWEAQAQVEAARTQVWRLWAAAQGVSLPVYGITAILDDGRALPLPPGIEATVVPLDPAALAGAAGTLLDLLDGAWQRGTEGAAPPPMSAYVRGQVGALAARRGS